MYWCALLGRADEGFELAVRLVREAPAYAGFDLVLDTLEELQRRGRDAEVVELGLSYCEQLQVLRPRIHRVIGQAAEALGDVLLAHDQHFIDMHGFGSWSTVEEIVEHPMFEMLGRHRQDPIADTLLKAYAEAESGHRHARTPWGRRRKAWRLRLQVALLSWQLPERAAGLLSTRQLIAEGLSQLWRITGEDDVGELAQQQWSALVTDHPWWAPGWLQAAYFLDDRGATDLARESFLRAERIAPRSIQVTQGRERFFPRSETERARLAAFWKRFQQSTDEGIHQEEERA
jgi:hypothetical protein